MKILPVIDLMNGVVVRARAGRRHEYRPVVSCLTASVQPLDVARAFRDRLGLSEIYLADLDAIGGGAPSRTIFAQLLDQGFTLWVDAGIGAEASHLRSLAELGVEHVIAGLESLDGPAQLQDLVQLYGGSRLVFSLDMRDGRPLANRSWNLVDPWDIAEQAVRLGVRRMLILDLSAVGGNRGTPAGPLCMRLRSAFARLEITTGGGVRDVADLRELELMGIDNVLVASALHDGRLTADEVRSFAVPQ